MMLRVRLTDISDEDSRVPSSLSYKERKKGMSEILGQNKKGNSGKLLQSSHSHRNTLQLKPLCE